MAYFSAKKPSAAAGPTPAEIMKSLRSSPNGSSGPVPKRLKGAAAAAAAAAYVPQPGQVGPYHNNIKLNGSHVIAAEMARRKKLVDTCYHCLRTACRPGKAGCPGLIVTDVAPSEHLRVRVFFP